MDLDEYINQRRRLAAVRENQSPHGSKRDTDRVDQIVISEGLQQLDDVYGTLSVKNFKAYDSPELYTNGPKRVVFKRKIGKPNEYYVLYSPNIKENERIRRNDILTLFTGTSSLRISVRGVTEHLKRVRSAFIMTNPV